MSIINYLLYRFYNIIITGYSGYLKSHLGKCGKNVVFFSPFHCIRPELVFLDDNTNIFSGFNFISNGGRFIMKENSGAAQGFTVITGNHIRKLGLGFKNEDGYCHKDLDKEKDVIVNEDVWIGANVTICAGVSIGRGANIGAGSVIRHDIPPYAIVAGNPAKVIGFSFTPEEIIEHERVLYPEEERLPFALLEKNHEKFFLKRLKEIKEFTKL